MGDGHVDQLLGLGGKRAGSEDTLSQGPEGIGGPGGETRSLLRELTSCVRLELSCCGMDRFLSGSVEDGRPAVVDATQREDFVRYPAKGAYSRIRAGMTLAPPALRT
jgi:hypothetical protein